MRMFRRTLIALASLAFLGLGVGFWLAPQILGRLLGIEALGVRGQVSLQADLGGLFAGLGLLSGLGLWMRRSGALAAAALLLAAVALGRGLAWLLFGSGGGTPVELGLEAALAALLLL